MKSMLPLGDPRWLTLSSAYGAASDIPKFLADAEKFPEDNRNDEEPYFSLWSALCHQGDVYSASYAAVPHLVRIVEGNLDNFRWTLLALVDAIEVSRFGGHGPPMPSDLQEPYQRALARIPAFASELLIRDLDEVELRTILAACASAKGYHSISEAVTELSPEVTIRFLEDMRNL